ncbi:MAG: phosphate signaling complex protein PhoU [Phycisphaeraceae bacterium]|nr:phosphate signaling complex protein PhoU [Phycisphaeraceae bacterium]
MSSKVPPPVHHPMPGKHIEFDDALDGLYRSLLNEGALAVRQVELAIKAFREVDREAATEVRKGDDEVDAEEVRIEEECLRLIATHHPVARDLRRIMAVIKINAELERIADHATGLCKAVLYLDREDAGAQGSIIWQPSLLEMADRILPRAHETLRALQRMDPAIALTIIRGDETLDVLAKRAFEEIEQDDNEGRISARTAMLAFRASRELERISDLLGSVCEDIIYMDTGRIVRHGTMPGSPTM